MLPRENRLVSDYDFRLTKERGNLVKRPFFLAVFYPRNDNKASRFGFVVSAKISKKSVERNRIKRLFREAIRALLFRVRVGYNIVFIARKKCLSIYNRSFLIEEVEDVLKSKGLLK